MEYAYLTYVVMYVCMLCRENVVSYAVDRRVFPLRNREQLKLAITL